VELEAQIGRMKRTMLSSKILRRRFEMSSFLFLQIREEAVELEAQIGRMKRTMLSSKILRRSLEMSSFLKINLKFL
jgi:hypothetical protein